MRLEVGVFGEGFALDQRSGWEVEGLVGMVERYDLGMYL